MKTLIILDWDDTLFPTSWIINKGIDLTDIDIQNKYIVFFSKLDMIIHKLIFNMIKYGKVVIVTNAMTKWVDISSNVLPNTSTLIQKHVKVISAKDLYIKKYPQKVMLWKKLIFHRLIHEYFRYSKSYQNIISIGDANYEYNALVSLYDKNNDSRYLKSIKFINKPTFDKLVDQLEILYRSISNVVKKKDQVDLVFDDI